jgi:predicted double-glycine peptidase
MKKSKKWRWVVILAIFLGVTYQIQQFATGSFPPVYEIKNFPLFTQPDGISCGPSSLKMLLEHYGKPLNLDLIRKQTRTDYYIKDDIEIGGTTQEYMTAALEYFDVPATMMTADIDNLKWYVSQGRPPAALVRSGDKYWHWVVVIGYTEDTVITADPGGGKRKVLPTKQFENAWNFTSDLHGRDLTKKCLVCGGSGTINEYLGPFGICDLCGGLGKLPDWYWILVALGESRGYVIVVPDNPPTEK